MKTGLEIISEERGRQVAVEKWTAEHDDLHVDSELALAAVTYALPESIHMKLGGVWVTEREDDFWPFDQKWFKPTPEDRIRELAKAGALIAAEIDRLLRIKN